jgi:hypothetical protein
LCSQPCALIYGALGVQLYRYIRTADDVMGDAELFQRVRKAAVRFLPGADHDTIDG